MSKVIKPSNHDDMQAEYDFSRGVRGKYFGRVTKDSPVFLVSENLPANVVHSMRSAFRQIRKKVDQLDELLRQEERRLSMERRSRARKSS